MTDLGLVSIITPAFNSGEYIGETIRSIQGQSYKNWELLITDDGSSDNTCKIVEDFAEKDERIKLFRLGANEGVSAARNKSISEAQGKFIAFCDSDDTWAPEKLECQLKFMANHNYEFVFSGYNVINEKGKIIGYMPCENEIKYTDIIKINNIGCLTAIYNAEKIGRIFMPPLKKSEDWALWIKILSKGVTAYGIQKPLADYRERTASFSSNKFEMLKYNFLIYHKFLNKSIISSLASLLFIFIPNYLLKKLKFRFQGHMALRNSYTTQI